MYLVVTFYFWETKHSIDIYSTSLFEIYSWHGWNSLFAQVVEKMINNLKIYNSEIDILSLKVYKLYHWLFVVETSDNFYNNCYKSKYINEFIMCAEKLHHRNGLICSTVFIVIVTNKDVNVTFCLNRNNHHRLNTASSCIHMHISSLQAWNRGSPACLLFVTCIFIMTIIAIINVLQTKTCERCKNDRGHNKICGNVGWACRFTLHMLCGNLPFISIVPEPYQMVHPFKRLTFWI